MADRSLSSLTCGYLIADPSFAGFLTNFIGFFVPMYFSLAALESPQPQDDIQWCVVPTR